MRISLAGQDDVDDVLGAPINYTTIPVQFLVHNQLISVFFHYLIHYSTIVSDACPVMCGGFFMGVSEKKKNILVLFFVYLKLDF